MYESHFGFTGPPFQLNPDPAFLFESRGHGKALSYLRFGVQQGEGFIVISGDIGAGKTTLVRALLGQLDPQRIVAAQVSNTQLDASDLLQAILTAFGVPAGASGKAGLIARMEAFLTSVAASGRRALLVVDEAQNLSLQAVEELRMLSNFQLGHHGLMQSFLVGQPELRDQLQSPAMEQLRQRILASYHLGPMDADETARYVEHRLRHVGWTGLPAFDEAALDELHRRSGGIPRRINMLCNRLLLAAYLGSLERIGAPLVAETADELWSELQRPVLRPVPPVPAAVSAPPAPVAQPPASPEPAGGLAAAASVPAVTVVADWRPRAPAPAAVASASPAPAVAEVEAWWPPDGAPVLALADDAWSWTKLQSLARRWSARPGLPPFVLVHTGSAATAALPGTLPWRAAAEHHLDLPADGDPVQVGVRLAALVAARRPVALLVVGHSYGLLHGALAARRAQIPVVRLDAGERRGQAEAERGALATLIDRTAELLCVASLSEQQDLAVEGFPSRRIVRTGPLAASAVHDLAAQRPDPAEALARSGASQTWQVRAAGGFGLVTGQFDRDDIEPADALQWVLLARHAQTELPLLWLAEPHTARCLADPQIRRHLESSDIAIVPRPSPLEVLALLGRARCLLAGPARHRVDEARASQVPAIVLDLYGDPVVPLDGGPIVRVGASTTQLMDAVRAALHRGSTSTVRLPVVDALGPSLDPHPAAGSPAEVSGGAPAGETADPAGRLVLELQSWLSARERHGLHDRFDEAVA